MLLFAFSTAITWCYYGDRSTAYIFGERGVFWYRNFYVLCFILAAVIDTTIVWNIAYVVVALVSIPNLIALFVLRNEMKNQREEVNKLRVIVSNVKNVIGDRSRDDTATEIMGTDLHLHYYGQCSRTQIYL